MRKRKTTCKFCPEKGVTSQTHCEKCGHHHSKSLPCKHPPKNKSGKKLKGTSTHINNKCPDAIFYYDNESDLFLPSKENKLSSQECFKMAGNVNNMHCIDPPGDGDCLFSIFCLIAKANQWEDVPTKLNDVRAKVSDFIKK